MFLWVSGNDFFLLLLVFFFFCCPEWEKNNLLKKNLLPLAPVHIVNWYCFCLINFFNLEKRFNFLYLHL